MTQFNLEEETLAANSITPIRSGYDFVMQRSQGYSGCSELICDHKYVRGLETETSDEM